MWPVILGSLGWSIIIAFIYIFFTRFCTAFIVYTTILLVEAALVGFGLVFFWRKDFYDSVEDSFYSTSMTVIAIIFWALAAIWLIFICFMCNRIRLAVALLEVTA